MNALSQSSSVRQPTYELASTRVAAEPISSCPQRSLTAVQRARFKQPTDQDGRISSLKILALTLLKHIESLERQAASSESDDLNLQNEVRRFEAELIRSALIRTGGRQRRAARLLGMKVTTLNTKIRRYQIRLDDSRAVYEDKSEALAEQSSEVS